MQSNTVIGILIMILGMIILASTDAISKYLTVTFAVIQILWIRYMVFAVIGTLVVLKKHGVAISSNTVTVLSGMSRKVKKIYR